MDKNEVGIKFKRLRKTNGLSFDEVFRPLELEEQEYLDIEQGKKHPNKEALEKLCDFYGITNDQLMSESFIDYNKVKKNINIVQLILSGLLFLVFFMPFAFEQMTVDHLVSRSGFYFALESVSYNSLNSMSFYLLLLLFNLLFFIGLNTPVLKTSNIYKTAAILINVFMMIFLWFGNYAQEFLLFPLIASDTILVLLIVISIVDMVKFPLEHDFKMDLFAMRRVFVTIEVFVLAIIFLGIFIDSGFDIDTEFGTLLFVISWAIYILAYPFYKKEFYESRIKVSIVLLLPSVMYMIGYSLYALQTGDEMLPEELAPPMFLLIPVFIINWDFFVDKLVPKKDS